MSTNTPDIAQGDWIHAGENLRRHKTSGVYYAFVKRGRKQFRRSLKTNDAKFARRRLADFIRDVDLLERDSAQITFADLASRWLDTNRHALKPSTVKRREVSIKAVSPFFVGFNLRNITPRHCEAWLAERGAKVAPLTFTKELETMRALFKYAIAQGLILRNPADGIKRPRIWFGVKVALPRAAGAAGEF